MIFQLKNILLDGFVLPPTPGEQPLELWPGLNLKEESVWAPRWTAKFSRPYPPVAPETQPQTLKFQRPGQNLPNPPTIPHYIRDRLSLEDLSA